MGADYRSWLMAAFLAMMLMGAANCSSESGPALDNQLDATSESIDYSSGDNAPLNRSWQEDVEHGSGQPDQEVAEQGVEQGPVQMDPDNGTTTTDWANVWPYFDTGCLEWLPINHIYFQLANTFLFLSYLAPGGIGGLIYLRVMLAVGSAFFAIWGWIVLCAFDTFLWNAFFLLINLVHIVVLLFSLRPVRFDKQVEEVSVSPLFLSPRA